MNRCGLRWLGAIGALLWLGGDGLIAARDHAGMPDEVVVLPAFEVWAKSEELYFIREARTGPCRSVFPLELHEVVPPVRVRWQVPWLGGDAKRRAAGYRLTKHRDSSDKVLRRPDNRRRRK